MGWLDLSRVPEPEVMDDAGEVEAYASAAAQTHLEAIDDTFVEHALRLLDGRGEGRALDIGTGPGQIVRKLARRLPAWRFTGVDRSPNMVAQAEKDARAEELTERVEFRVSDGNRLEFPGACFDFVMCNSVLHHLAEPQRVLAEVHRVARPGAAILIRDLRRPLRLAFPLHVRWHGRRYSGLMYKLFCDSVRAAYTPAEIAAILAASPLAGARVFLHRKTHLGIERPLAEDASRQPIPGGAGPGGT